MQELKFFFAFVVVLALIGVAAWLVRRFASNRLGANTNRGRMPRLAVIDAAAVDGRRRLVLVRRDNIEHLLMIGGPTDIVVESNIVRAMPARDQTPRDQMQSRPSIVAAEPPPRIMPLPDSPGWSTDNDITRSDAFDHPEPQMPELPPRPLRSAFADEVRRPASTPSERRSERSDRNDRSDPLASLTPEPLISPMAIPLAGRPEPRPELRGEPMPSRVTSRNEPTMPRAPRPSEAPKVSPVRAPAPERSVAPTPPPPPAPALPTADQNLAEMAQRLEAALRRPAGDSGEPRVGAPPVAPEPPPARSAPRAEPPVAPPAAPPSTKSGFENLEDEMASLLGRPKTPS
jgi:flagellar protein FliO/FliZ